VSRLENLKTQDFLQKVKLFNGADSSQLRRIEQVLQQRCVRKGAVIIEENSPGHEMYLLVEGKVEVSNSLTLKTGKNTFAEKEKSLNFLDSKNYCFFGEIAMIDSAEKRTATVTALTDCTLFVIERQDFEEICQADYRLGFLLIRNIAEGLCSRLKKSNNDLLKLTTALSIALSR